MTKDLFTLSFRWYEEALWGKRKLGPARYSIDLGHYAIILEFWFWRDRASFRTWF